MLRGLTLRVPETSPPNPSAMGRVRNLFSRGKGEAVGVTGQGVDRTRYGVDFQSLLCHQRGLITGAVICQMKKHHQKGSKLE